LNYARRDVESGKLTDDDQRFAVRATEEIIEELSALRGQTSEPPAEASGVSPAAVLCVPARDETDHAAARMLEESLSPRWCQTTVVSPALLASEVVQAVEKLEPELVCIVALPPGGLAHTRLLCMRLRARFHELKIVVGRWGLKGNLDKNRDQVLAAGADHFAIALSETRKQVMALAQLGKSRQPSALAPADDVVEHSAGELVGQP
jgi:hypothetical protein